MIDVMQIDRRCASPSNPLHANCQRCANIETDAAPRISIATLYASAGPSIFARALRITRSRQAAEEVVQDVFTHAWLHTESYDHTRSTLVHWLLMLCRSRSIDYLRSRKSVEANELAVPGWADVSGDVSGPEEIYIDCRQASAVHHGLQSLAAKQRQMLVLSYYADLSHAQIARQMLIPLGTVKTTIRSAHQRLAALLLVE